MCSVRLYSDRAGHFFVTPKAGEQGGQDAFDASGAGVAELGIKMIPAYSPQARGRSERSFRTWQGRLPQELRLRGIATGEANEFLGEHVQASSTDGSAWRRRRKGVRLCGRGGRIWRHFQRAAGTAGQSGQHIALDNRVFQIEKTRWRNTLAG